MKTALSVNLALRRSVGSVGLATVIRFAIALALIALTGGDASVFAQENHVGIKGGISIPRLSGGGDNEVSRDYQSRLAFTFGGFFDFGISERFSIQPEVNFAGQGGKRKGVQPITSPIPGLPQLPPGFYFYGEFENEAILNYLEVPVLAKYRFGKSGGSRFYVNGGLYYGYLLSAKTETRGSSTIYLDRNKTPLLIPPANQPLPPVPFDATTDIENEVHHHNFGLTGGAGFQIPQGENHFFIEARVSYGLRAIQKDTTLNGNSHTGNFVISVGYAVKLK